MIHGNSNSRDWKDNWAARKLDSTYDYVWRETDYSEESPLTSPRLREDTDTTRAYPADLICRNAGRIAGEAIKRILENGNVNSAMDILISALMLSVEDPDPRDS